MRDNTYQIREETYLITVKTGINLQCSHSLTKIGQSNVSGHLARLQGDRMTIVRIGKNVQNFLLI